MKNIKFTADTMLGRLALWLRLFGFDTFYERKIEKNKIIHNVLTEERILLTRNTQIVKMKILREHSFLVLSDHFREQLVEVLSHFNLQNKIEPFSRCLRCNEELIEIEKEKVKNRVPPYVFKTQQDFSFCPTCKKIYWSATHIEKANNEINRILEKLN